MHVAELTDILSSKNKKERDPGISSLASRNSRIQDGISTMVIISKYRLERNEEKDIFSNQ